MYKHGPLAGLN